MALPEWVTGLWWSNRIGTAEHGMVSAETHRILLSPVQHHWLTETAAPPLEEVHQVLHHSKTMREETTLNIKLTFMSVITGSLFPSQNKAIKKGN